MAASGAMDAHTGANAGIQVVQGSIFLSHASIRRLAALVVYLLQGRVLVAGSEVLRQRIWMPGETPSDR